MSKKWVAPDVVSTFRSFDSEINNTLKSGVDVLLYSVSGSGEVSVRKVHEDTETTYIVESDINCLSYNLVNKPLQDRLDVSLDVCVKTLDIVKAREYLKQQFKCTVAQYTKDLSVFKKEVEERNAKLTKKRGKKYKAKMKESKERLDAADVEHASNLAYYEDLLQTGLDELRGPQDAKHEW